MREAKFECEIAAALMRDAATPGGADSAALSREYSESIVARVRNKLDLICAHRGRARRYFTTQALADAFARGHLTTREKAGAAYQPDAARSRALRACWSADAQPVITSKTKVTIAPPPPTNVYRSNWFKGQ